MIQESLKLIMQMAAEKIALNQDSLDFICAWAEMAEEYGEV